jgi:hypothetical protein
MHGLLQVFLSMFWAQKRLSAVFLLLLLSGNAVLFAERGHFLIAQAGLDHAAQRDKSMSPLAYGGSGIATGIAYEHGGRSSMDFFHLSFQSGEIRNRYGNSCSYQSVAFRNYTFYPKQGESGNATVFGWSNINAFHRYVNAAYGNYADRLNYYTLFGPAFRYALPFRIGKLQFHMQLPVDLQILGFYLRPSYISNRPSGYLDPENSAFMAWLRSVDLFIPGRDWHFSLNPQLNLMLGSGGRLSLTYQYQFVRIAKPELFVQSKGTWYISLVTKL